MFSSLPPLTKHWKLFERHASSQFQSDWSSKPAFNSCSPVFPVGSCKRNCTIFCLKCLSLWPTPPSGVKTVGARPASQDPGHIANNIPWLNPRGFLKSQGDLTGCCFQRGYQDFPVYFCVKHHIIGIILWLNISKTPARAQNILSRAPPSDWNGGRGERDWERG